MTRLSTPFFYFLISLLASVAFLGADERLPPLRSFDYSNPPEGLFLDEWMELRIFGQKAGYSRTRFWREKDKVYTDIMMEMKVLRDKRELHMHVSQSTVETVAGEPLEISLITQMGKQPILMKGIIRDGQIEVTMGQGANAFVNTHTFVDGVKMLWGLAQENHSRGFDVGTAYTLHYYSPDFVPHMPIDLGVNVVREEHTEYLGTRVAATRVETRMAAGDMFLESVSWMDEHGRAIKTLIDTPGMPMELYLVKRERALESFEGAEVFLSMLLPLQQPIEKRAKEVVFELSAIDGSPIGLAFPETINQRVRRLSDTETEVTVYREGEAPPMDTLDDVDPVYLKSSVMVNLEDPKLVELYAKALRKSYKSPHKIAKRLSSFVSDYIEHKNLGVGFASSSEVCREPEGDCTEHAVLLTALGRLAGIPSRVAAGIAYVPRFEEEKYMMGYHMWTQFYIDGQWYDYDALFIQTRKAPHRIALAVSALDDVGMSQTGLALLQVIGNLKVSVKTTPNSQ